MTRTPQTSNPFQTEDKSAATGIETKEDSSQEPDTATEPEAPLEPAVVEPEQGIKVEMIHHYTHEDRDLIPGDQPTLPARVATSLVAASFAKLI